MKQKPLSWYKKKLWEVFSKFIRLRDGGICFICGRRCEGSGYHAGHFIAKSICGLFLYFDENNVHGCCYHCNINLGGNTYEYSLKLGAAIVERIYAQLPQSREMIWDRKDYQEKIDYYKEKLTNA